MGTLLEHIEDTLGVLKVFRRSAVYWRSLHHLLTLHASLADSACTFRWSYLHHLLTLRASLDRFKVVGRLKLVQNSRHVLLYQYITPASNTERTIHSGEIARVLGRGGPLGYSSLPERVSKALLYPISSCVIIWSSCILYYSYENRQIM